MSFAIARSLLAADERELGALRVCPDNDVLSRRDLVRTHEDRSARGVDGFLGGRDRGHADVVAPLRLLSGHRAAERADPLTMMVEEAVFAHFAHIHELVAAPAELLAVEAPRGRRIAGR